jgi:hypothetical protein
LRKGEQARGRDAGRAGAGLCTLRNSDRNSRPGGGNGRGRYDVGRVRDSADVKVDGVPFGQDDRELRAYRSRALLMNLALTVLDDASRRATTEAVCTPAVRRALRVLRPYLASRDLLLQFWTEAEAAHGRAVNQSLLLHRWIVTGLGSRAIGFGRNCADRPVGGPGIVRDFRFRAFPFRSLLIRGISPVAIL